MAKLWGGRFEKQTESYAESFHSSISFDCRLYRQDIAGSIAHAKMLEKIGILTEEELAAIAGGLEEILAGIDSGEIRFDPHDEDIHMNVERLLIERIGEPGRKLHTGRSRNDQVALDMRMYMKKAITAVQAELKELLQALIDIAKENTDTVLSAYTHLQKAQPTTLAHYMMAYFEMFKRDFIRFDDCFERTDVMPLGSGAVCSTTYPLDRKMVRDLLDFQAVTDNSMDAVSDRDFLIEFSADASIAMMHLSRFCEELILWSTDEFRYVSMDDAYSTGSSIMPQKKNPDMAELIRGKTGRVYGSLMTLLTVMKGLPLAYNKDMQEDKEAAFDAFDTLYACLKVFAGMLKTVHFNKENMRARAGNGFTNATDAADYLVKKGMPFRSAHETVGRLVLYCEQAGKSLEQVTLAELQALSPLFGEDFYPAVSLETCVNARSVYGGPAEKSVLAHIKKAQLFLKNL
jgi:argininosuccinate lyase